ncbi:MAG TPA: PQQ-dependent sugar dehydrogenase [Fibrobacteria bacterium]|nr:PQQ-dependent sugar dehydrogenase [Fibrobacteria bacterium]
MHSKRSILNWPGLAVIILGSVISNPLAQLKYPNCPDVTKADFTKVPLITRSAHLIDEPIEMALAKDGRIFWVERKGKVRVFDQVKKTAVTLMTLPVFTGQEFGATGIALDPAFESNNWFYVYWAVSALNPDGSRNFRVSRFTLSGETASMETQKIIIEIPFTNFGCCHTSGSMTFDKDGNLFVGVGNTTDNGIGDGNSKTNYVNEAQAHGDDQRGSANTNSLLGKILRIRPKPIADADAAPTPGVGSTYDIPEGNLFPPGMNKTRPEIYTMGHRNPYTISVDPIRSWLTWGDIGPDEQIATEEHNLVTQPGNMGWPYFAGNNLKFRGTVGIPAAQMNPDKPVNKSSRNTGLDTLPPAQPAIRPYIQSAAITGPIYHYDGRLTAPYRLPPHFNKKWIITDFNNGTVRVTTPSEDGKSLTSDIEFWGQRFLSRPLDMELGPEGALYVLDYDGWFSAGTMTGISRVEYKGTCEDKSLFPATTALREAGRINGLGRGGLLVRPGAGSLVLPVGVKGVDLYDMSGARVHSHERTEASSETVLALPESLRGSLLRARFR